VWSDDSSAVPDFAELYRAHVSSVWRWVHRLAGPDGELEDLVQDIFVIAHRRLPHFRRESAITTWLYGITAKVVRDHRRKKRFRALWVRPRQERDEASVEAQAPMLLEQRELNVRVYKVLDRLNERYRTVLIFHEIEGLGAEEIATLLGAKSSNVWMWLHRARQSFAKHLAVVEQEEAR
jgi:RNA polymerase sigma-70 factor (ECF subfamily)